MEVLKKISIFILGLVLGGIFTYSFIFNTLQVDIIDIQVFDDSDDELATVRIIDGLDCWWQHQATITEDDYFSIEDDAE